MKILFLLDDRPQEMMTGFELLGKLRARVEGWIGGVSEPFFG